jgi:hypothetical protein
VVLLPGSLPAQAEDEVTVVPADAGARQHLVQRLQSPVSVFRTRVSVRNMFERLAELQDIAILLDRRIDPDRLIDVQLVNVTLQEGLDLIAAQAEGVTAVIGATIFVGPPEGVDRIRTSIELSRPLTSGRMIDRPAPAARPPGDTETRRTFDWNDLQRPDRLLDRICSVCGVSLHGTVRPPYDLWGSGTLAGVTVREAVAVVAGQYELTSSWSADAVAVTLADMPQRLTVARVHRPSSVSVERAIELLQERFPHVHWERQERALRIEATATEHDQLTSLWSRASDDSRTDRTRPISLARREFTLRNTRASAAAILRTLKAQNVNVVYDSAELEAAGIDLTTVLELHLEKASAEEFFAALCAPLGITFQITGETVRLSPRPAPR